MMLYPSTNSRVWAELAMAIAEKIKYT